MKLVPAAQYHQELLDHLPHASRRIILATMILGGDPATDEIAQLLIAARTRGVAVTVLFDVYTLSPFGYQDITDPLGYYRWRRRLQSTLSALEAAGVTVYRVGHIGPNPYAGRWHAKYVVIDDRSYTFGGVNLDQASFTNADYMLRQDDPALADFLGALTDRAGQGDKAGNLSHELDRDSTLLFDDGETRRSIIYDTACQLAESAQRVYYVSQFCPSGKLAAILARTDCQAYYNRTPQLSLPANIGQAFDRLRGSVPNQYRHETYIHAKYMLFETADGHRTALTGSHNFSWRGVAFGTQEIALLSTDQDLWQQLYDYLQRRIIA